MLKIIIFNFSYLGKTKYFWIKVVTSLIKKILIFFLKGSGDGLGVNLRSIVVIAVLMLLMMFAVHCTWVTSNAYSSPSIGKSCPIHNGFLAHQKCNH